MSETEDASTVDTAVSKNGRPSLLPAAALLIGAALAYGAIAFQVVLSGQISAEEAMYLIKAGWYASGQAAPYTAIDATAQMPFYFYQLGFWQRLVDLGLMPARLMSVGIGVINAALVFVICRRLTANTLAAAAAVFIFLATPATAFSFAAATPAATVSALHLGTIWLIVASLGRPRPWATVLMGLLGVALYFYRQNMLLSIVVLVPLYLAAIGRARWLHAALLLGTIALAVGGVLFLFPEKMGDYALRLPAISPLLDKLGLLAPNFTLIDRGTIGATTMGPAFDRIAPADVLDYFLLPYGGTVLLAAMLFGLVGAGLRVLWFAPLYFFWLAASHYLASLGYCQTCIISYTPYYSGLGALAAAVSLAMLAHRARQNMIPAAPCVLFGAVLAVALNAFAPSFAVHAEARDFPIPMMAKALPTSEAGDVEILARWISANTPPREPILVLHSLGRQSLPALPYAVFLAERTMPTQSINPAAGRRVVNPKLSAQARESVQAAIEEESLWTDSTLARWIERDYDVVLFQEDRSIDQRPQIAAITAHFELATATIFRGSNIFLYKRKSVQ